MGPSLTQRLNRDMSHVTSAGHHPLTQIVPFRHTIDGRSRNMIGAPNGGAVRLFRGKEGYGA